MRTLDDLKACRDTESMDPQPYLEWAVSEIERLRGVVDACNVTALIAHAIQDGMINEKVEGAFSEALDGMNEALKAAKP